MEAMFVLITVIGGLLVLGAAATEFGIDSRDPIGDDHARQAGQ